MTTKEITTATNMLRKCGRTVTGTIRDERGSKPMTAIQTDGDGIKQPFGTPRVFTYLASVRDYVAGRA